jgi:vacuolar-type H+-ATPase subunit H
MSSAAPTVTPAVTPAVTSALPVDGEGTLAEVARLEELLGTRRRELDLALTEKVAQAAARAQDALEQARAEAERLAAEQVAEIAARTDREVAEVLAAADAAAERLGRVAAEQRGRAASLVLDELLGDEPPRAGG